MNKKLLEDAVVDAVADEKGSVSSAMEAIVSNEDGKEIPTEEELRTLVRVADEIP
jgi:hypothetical protein